MNTYFHNVMVYFEQVVNPASGKPVVEKRKKRSSDSIGLFPMATPDSMNIRDVIKRQDSFRRNPAP